MASLTSIGTQAIDTATTTPTFTLPAGTALKVLFIEWTGNAITITNVPTGYSTVLSHVAAAGNPDAQFALIASDAATSDTSVQLTFSANVQPVAIRAVPVDWDFANVESTLNDGGDDTPSHDATFTTDANTLHIPLHFWEDSRRSINTYPETGQNTQVQNGVTGAGTGGIGLCTVNTATDPYDPGSFVRTGNVNRGTVHIVVKHAGAPAGTLKQSSFRVRDDSAGLNAGTGWYAAENTNPSVPAEKVIRLRFEVAAVGGAKAFTSKLQYNRSGAGWVDVPVQSTPYSTGITPAAVESVLSAQFTDGDATTNVLTTETGTFVAGSGDEASNAVASVSLASGEHTEVEFAVMIRKFFWSGSATTENTGGTTIQFRMVEGDGTVFTTYTNTPTVTLSSPKLLGGCWPEAPNTMGPFVDTNGNMYFLMESWELKTNGGEVVVLKSTDGGVTWAAQDIANAPTNKDFESCAIVHSNQTTGLLQIFSHHSTSVVRHEFRMSDHATSPDTWGAKDQAVASFGDVIGSMQHVTVAQRSDGDLIVFYNYGDGTDNNIGFKISVNEGASWGSETQLDTTANVNHHNAWVAVDGSDTTYIAYHEEPGAYGDNTMSVYVKRLTSADVLDADGSRTTISGATMQSGSGERGQVVGVTYHDDSGVEVVTVGYTDKINGAAATPLRSRAFRDGSLQAEKTATTTDVNQGGGASQQSEAEMVVDSATKTLHALFVDNVTFDLWHVDEVDDAGWGTESEVQDAIAGGWVRTAVLTRSGTRYLAYVYDNGTADGGGGQGPVYYDEITLGGGTALVKVQNETVQASEGDLHPRGLARIQSETEQLSEADLRLLGLVRLVEETVSISEQDLRTLSLIRIQSETVQISEGVLRILALLRQWDETVQITETDLHIRGLLRQEDETEQVSETDMHVRGLLRQQGETVQVSEVDLHLLALLRLENETVETTESVLKVLALLRQLDETVQISEGDIRVLGLLRQEDETVQISETDLRYLGKVRQQDETVQISETDLKYLGKVRVESESVQISEADLHFLGLVRVQDETLQISDADLRFLGLVRIVSETEQISEGDLRFLALLKVQNETIQISEDTIAARSLLRLIAETEQISEADLHFIVTGGTNIIKVVDETVQISEGDLHFLGIVVVQSETVQISEQVLSALGLTRVTNETLQISEVDLHLRTLVRVQDEAVQLAEGVLTTRDLIRLESETLQLAEQVLRTMALLRTETETVQLSEADLRVLGLLQIETETLQISEVDLYFTALSTAPVIVHATITLIPKPQGLEVVSGPMDVEVVSGPMDIEVIYDSN